MTDLLPTTPTSDSLDVGDEWLIGVTLAEPTEGVTVVVTVTSPDGTTSTPAVTEEFEGAWTATVDVDEAGRWLAVATASGGVSAVVPFTVYATVPVPASGMPDLAEVKAYLDGTSATDEQITDALAAESAAQRRRCTVPADYPDDLRQALKRRVARNLAARAVPIAQVTSFEGGATATRVPLTDAEVVRLEAPYRRMTLA